MLTTSNLRTGTHWQLEGLVDVHKWQSDFEVARLRDHRELLRLGQRIESENAAISRELAQQGATIAEVLRIIHVRRHRALSPRASRPASVHSLRTLIHSHLINMLRNTLSQLCRTSTPVCRMLTLPGGEPTARLRRCRRAACGPMAHGALVLLPELLLLRLQVCPCPCDSERQR